MPFPVITGVSRVVPVEELDGGRLARHKQFLRSGVSKADQAAAKKAKKIVTRDEEARIHDALNAIRSGYSGNLLEHFNHAGSNFSAMEKYLGQLRANKQYKTSWRHFRQEYRDDYLKRHGKWSKFTFGPSRAMKNRVGISGYTYRALQDSANILYAAPDKVEETISNIFDKSPLSRDKFAIRQAALYHRSGEFKHLSDLYKTAYARKGIFGNIKMAFGKGTFAKTTQQMDAMIGMAIGSRLEQVRQFGNTALSSNATIIANGLVDEIMGSFKHNPATIQRRTARLLDRLTKAGGHRSINIISETESIIQNLGLYAGDMTQAKSLIDDYLAAVQNDIKIVGRSRVSKATAEKAAGSIDNITKQYLSTGNVKYKELSDAVSNNMARAQQIGARNRMMAAAGTYLFAYQIGMEAINIGFTKLWNFSDKISNAVDKLRSFDFGSGRALTTQQASTERQRALKEIKNSRMSARSYLGSEARLMSL